MKKTHGQLLKEWANKKGISTQQIALKRGVNRQSVYQDFGKQSLKITTLESYCKVYGIDVTQLLSNEKTESDLKDDDIFTKGDGYLMKYVAELEERVREQGNTMREQSLIMKDQSKTISVLLGKSKGLVYAGFDYFFSKNIAK